MEYVVTVEGDGKSNRYWVQADSPESASAKGYRLHCASDNYNPSKRAVVADCKEVQI